MEDFAIIYSYPYKGFFEEKSVKYALEGEEKRNVAYALREGLELSIGSLVFSGIDWKAIKEYVEGKAKESLEGTLKALKLSEVVKPYKEKKLSGVAEVYAIRAAVEMHGESYIPTKEEMEKEGIKLKEEGYEKKRGIGFVIRYREWVAIKKTSYEDAEDYMIAGGAASINDTITERFWSFLGRKAEKGRKSIKGLISSFASLKGEGLERRWEVYRAFVENGYMPYATLEMLSKAYPDLKPKKPRGRWK